MADVKKIQGFNIKDEVARNSLEEWKYKVKEYNGGLLGSILLGSYTVPINSNQPSAVLKIGNLVHTFNNSNNVNNTGILKTFNIETNLFVEDKEILMGHANSVCYNPINNKIYVAPLKDYINNVDALYLYVYDTSFNYLGTLETPERISGLSFDFKENTMYAKASSFNFYKVENEEFTLIGHPELPDLNFVATTDISWNQALAVYDGKAYFSSPWNKIAVVDIETMNIINDYTVEDVDVCYKRIMKEIEDFEFTEEGHLIGIRYSNCGVIRMAYVVEYTVNQVGSYAPALNSNSIVVSTYYLSSEAQSKFLNDNNEIKSLMELSACIMKPTRVTINGNIVENYIIELFDDITLLINGSYTCDYIENYDKLSLAGGGTLITTNADYTIYNSRNGDTTFNSNTRLNITPGGINVNIACGQWMAQVRCRRTPTNTKGGGVKINNNVDIEDNSAYINAYKITLS